MIRKYLRYTSIVTAFILLTLIFPMPGSLASSSYDTGKACTCLTCIASYRNISRERPNDGNETQITPNGVETFASVQIADRGSSGIPDTIQESDIAAIKTSAGMGSKYVDGSLLVIVQSIAPAQMSDHDLQRMLRYLNADAYRNTHYIWIKNSRTFVWKAID